VNRITKWATMTREERQACLGDPSMNGERDDAGYDRYLASRLEQGLTLSLADKRRARAWTREQNKVLDTRNKGEENSNCSPRTNTSRR